jgi:ribosomal protein L29
MEIEKLSKADIKTYDATRLRETEKDLRRELAMIRMDVHTDKKVHVGKIRNIKKNVARVLTAQSELLQQAPANA